MAEMELRVAQLGECVRQLRMDGIVRQFPKKHRERLLECLTPRGAGAA